jgi:protein-disulfide isomerase
MKLGASEMQFFRRARAIFDIASTLLVTVAAGVLLWRLLYPSSPEPLEAGVTPVDESVAAARLTNVLGDGHVAIVEFADFECPFCGGHARDTFPDIRSRLVKSGQVRYVSLHLPLERIHPLATGAAEAAECAGRQGRYWEMHERLFADAKALAPAGLSNHAREIGLDAERFQRCLDDREALEKVRSDREEGERLGVRGTPAFFIGTVRDDGGLDLVKRINGVAPIETFETQVAELKGRTARRR